MSTKTVYDRRIIQKKKVVVRNKGMQLSSALIFFTVLFCIFAMTLVYERNMINDLDSQIRDLEDQYSTAVKLNEDLEGQLLSARNLDAVANYATKELGMVAAEQKDFNYIAYGNNTQTAVLAMDQGNEAEILSWVNNLFD